MCGVQIGRPKLSEGFTLDDASAWSGTSGGDSRRGHLTTSYSAPDMRVGTGGDAWHGRREDPAVALARRTLHESGLTVEEADALGRPLAGAKASRPRSPIQTAGAGRKQRIPGVQETREAGATHLHL